jgi:hypothetical protein
MMKIITRMMEMMEMVMNFFQLGHVTARTGVRYVELPISVQSCSPSSTANHIRRHWQDVVIRGLFRTSMPFPSVKQPNLEATQPALALLQGWSPVWVIMLSLLRARRNRSVPSMVSGGRTSLPKGAYRPFSFGRASDQ